MPFSVEAQVAQVVVHRPDQFGRALRRVPGCVRTAGAADLCHDREGFRIRVQRLADQLIGGVRAVVVARVDVINAVRHRFAQNSECSVAIPGRPEHTAPSELHCAVTHPVHDAVAEGERSGRRVQDFSIWQGHVA